MQTIGQTIMTKKWLLLLILVLVVGATFAHAHRPGVVKGETTVSDPYISWVFAGRFEKGDEVYVLKMKLDKPFATPFEMLIPRQESYRDFRPRYAIVGPGLPIPSRRIQAQLPKDVPDGAGVFYEAHEKENRYVFFEGIMRRAMWTSGTTAVPLQKGNYEIWIWQPDQKKGKFQFGFGVEERFDNGAFDGIFSDWDLYAY
jgi:hypothetical protein